MPRHAVKLLLLDQSGQLLLIHGKDPESGAKCWYPVGGGVDPNETLQEAAARETYEETGLTDLPPGRLIWRRDHTYEFNGRTVEVHEEWLLHEIAHFTPAPASLTDYESQTILGFRWWHATDLIQTTETVYPPQLGYLLRDLLTTGVPTDPVTLDT